MNNKRKNRGGSLRPQRTRSVLAEGVYNNAHFMHAATSQVGNIVRLQTASGNVWEGVFRTFSSDFDIVLEVAAKIDNPDSPNPTLIADSLVDKLIFKSCDIITMVAKDVDPEFATRDTFQTDTAISARLNGSQRIEERELEPWDASSGVNGDDNVPLELEAANGWDANDMFRKNEQMYGVTSTYDHTLAGYTLPLQPSDSDDYREAEVKAGQIANEIENQPNYKSRLDLENGDEESLYAAVLRPNQDSNGGKYIPPAKRKNQNAGKLMRSTPPPSQSHGGNVPAALPPKANAAPLQYPNHPPATAAPMGGGGYVRDSQGGGRERESAHHGPPQQQPQHPVHNSNSAHGMPHVGHNPPAPPQQQQQQQQQQHPPPHGRPHSHTPPHSYGGGGGPPSQRQGGVPAGAVPNGPKPQLNGETTKQMPPMQRPPRNVYASSNPPPPAQVYQEAAPPPSPQQQPKQEQMNHVMRHRDDTLKELHKFSQDFKLAEQQQQIPNQVPTEQLQKQPHPAPQPTPPQQSISPQQESIDKVTNTLKKSTLNPNAKEFVLNPAAKPFTPRSPSTPTASRPHTPQTPSHSPYIPATVSGGHGGQPPMPVAMMPMSYNVMMPPSQPPFQPQPQGNRIRKIPAGQMRADLASQMQVAAATGQPLLAPAPIQSFVYPPGINPQGYPQVHAVRMYDAPPQIQYLPPNPNNASNSAQPPQYNPGPGPQPPPQQYQPPPPQGHQYGLMCPIIQTPPHMMQGMQYLQQPPPPQGIQVILPPPQQAQQHGQAP